MKYLTEIMALRLTKLQMKRIVRAAVADGRPAANWVRACIEEKLKQVEGQQ